MAGFGSSIKLTGESEYQRALKQINQSLREVSSEMKVVSSSYDKNDKSTQAIAQRSNTLTKALEQQQAKLSVLTTKYNEMEKTYGKNSTAQQQLTSELTKEKAKLDEIGSTLGKTSKEYQSQEKVVNQLEDKQVEYNNAVSKAKTEMNQAQAEVNKTTKELNNLGKEEDDVTKKTKATGDGFTVFKGILTNLSTQAINGAISGLKSLGSSLISLGKQAISSYADYEQLVGGVETLFGTGGLSFDEWAKQNADDLRVVTMGAENVYNALKDVENVVLNNANNAYKTAGMSANQYMETVTSFAAALNSATGDVEVSARYADMAIQDMSDNANKMGTDMSMIQNAYQGFAKQNYTMLDNLKLGYGGTKTEMERLLADAEKFSGVKYDITNLADVYEAIHVVQTELGITGTTAKEASKTISGSANAMKSAWSNLLTGMANENANFDQLVQNLVDSVVTFGDNIIPRIQSTIKGIAKMLSSLLEKVVPKIIEVIPPLIIETLPIILNAVQTVLTSIMDTLPQIVDSISGLIPQIVGMLLSMLPQLLDVGINVILTLIQGITDALPDLIKMLPTIIMQIVDILVNNLPLIIDTGIALIFALIDGIIEALPDLIEKMPEIIDKLVVAITDNLPKIIEAGITLTIKLAEGLIKALPQLIAKIPQIMGSLVNGITSYYGKIFEIGKNLLSKMISGIGSMLSNLGAKVSEIVSTIFNKISELPSKMLDVGKNLVQGLWNGINNMTSWVVDKIKGFGESVLGGIKSFFGIASPSKLFKNEVGKYLAEGIGVGFEDEMKNVTNEMQNAIPTNFDLNGSYNNVSSPSNINYQDNYYSIVEAFKTALGQMKIEMDDEQMGKFVDKTVARTIYS